MFKKNMKFDDLEGNEVSQTFYFNYSIKEIMELIEFGYISKFPPADVSKRLPLEEAMKRLSTSMEDSGLTNQENNQQAYDIFQGLILDAYGEKGADNVTFVKNARTREYMESHVVFSDMIFEFLENEQLMIDFIEQCLPPKKLAEAKAAAEKEAQVKAMQPPVSELVETAAELQKNPETRIEPGPEAAAEALGTTPAVEKTTDGKTDAEILAETNPNNLTPAQLQRGFVLKTSR